MGYGGVDLTGSTDPERDVDDVKLGWAADPYPLPPQSFEFRVGKKSW